MADSPIQKRLKEARKAAQLSQKQLGIEAGIDEFSASARMNHYEKGRHIPDYSMLKRIAQVLKLPVAYFYAESDEMAEFIHLFNQLKKGAKQALLKKLTISSKKSQC
jgi:transcriptional regulator with XRE-family HTH domain